MDKDQLRKENIIASVEAFIRRNDRFPLSDEFKPENYLCSLYTVKNYFKMDLKQFHKTYFPDVKSSVKRDKWDQKKILVAIDAFIQKNGRFPTKDDLKNKNGLPSFSTIYSFFNMPLNEIQSNYFPTVYTECNKFKCDETKILAAIESFAQKNGRLPVKYEFTSKNGLPSLGTIERYFGTKSLKILKKYFPNVNEDHNKYKWDRERILVAIDTFIRVNDRFPLSYEFTSERGLPPLKTVKKTLNLSLPEIYEINFPNMNSYRKTKIKETYKRWDKNKIIVAIEVFIQKTGRLPIFCEFKAENDLPTLNTLLDHFQMNLPEIYKAYFPDVDTSRNQPTWNEEDILEAITEFINRNGRAPLTTEYQAKNGLPSYSTVRKFFNMNISDFYKTYFPIENTKNHCTRWNKEKIIVAIDAFIKKTGRFPACREFKTENLLPSLTVATRVLGTTPREFYNNYSKKK